MRAKSTVRVAGLLAAIVAIPALATFHLMRIVEIFPGTAASPNAQYVVLQMFAPGQNFVDLHTVTVFNASGALISTFTFGNDVPNGANQDKILIATPEAVAFFGLSADLTMSAALLSAGGKVCFSDTIDCVAWGAYSGSSVGVGTPYHVSGGLTSGKAAIRRLNISGGASTLDAGDDTDNCANDFIEGLPAPRNNSRVNGTIPSATCGNGTIEGLEQCDDHNLVDGDGCSSTCQVTPLAPALSIADASVSEGNAGTKLANFTISLAAASAGPVTFDITTDYGTATPGVDFVSNSANGQSIPAGQTSVNFPVTINGDTEVENNETFTVNVRNVVGAPVTDAQARGTINNDDQGSLSIADVTLAEGDSGFSTATFVLSLSRPMPTPVSFNIATSNGSATAGSDYVARSQIGRVLDAGRTQAVFEVSINGDATAESDETFTVTVSNVSGAALADGSATGTIQNDEPTLTTIARIQGSGVVSPMLGEVVGTEGVVTALTDDGFFLQASDGGRDADPATADAIFVASSDRSPRVGDALRVRGVVQEAQVGEAAEQLTVTQVAATGVALLSRDNPLPTPVPLDAGSVGANQALAGLERFEGMRVSLPQVTVVAPVGGSVDAHSGLISSDGRFYAVLAGLPRPFLEPGLGALARTPVRAGRNPEIFDGNPERLLIDSRGQRGVAALSVDAGDRIDGLVGVLGYGYGAYRLLPDAAESISVTPGASPRPVSERGAAIATIGNVNLRGVGIDAATRLAKSAEAICAYARAPDIVAVVNGDERVALPGLAAALAAGAGDRSARASCAEAMDYRSYPSADHGDFGFLVSAASARGGAPRVEVISLTQAGAAERFRHRDGSSELLNERAPLLLKARISGDDGGSATVTVIATQLSALDGQLAAPDAHGWPTRGDYLRARRNAQAGFLAGLIQVRQQADPSEMLVVLGDFDAAQFNDGFSDVLGVIAGRPSPRNRVLDYQASPIQRPLANLTALMPPAERYTVTRDGNAAALGHVLVNQALLSAYPDTRLEMARINADFGADNADDASVPVRGAEADPQVLFLERR